MILLLIPLLKNIKGDIYAAIGNKPAAEKSYEAAQI